MLKFLFILLFPLVLFSKIQVVTYFPLESHLINKIAQKEVKIREITSRYLRDYQELPQSEISRLSNGKIFFHFGLDIEKKYAELLLKENHKIIVVDISSNIQKIDNNPYIWTDPFNMRIVAKNIYDAFVKLDKYNEPYYKENYERFLDEIDQTFLKVKQKINSSEIEYIYVFDNFWDYFAKRFGIVTIQREKRYLSIAEIPKMSEFSRDKNIKKLLFSQYDNKDFILSISSNLNLQTIDDDIFNQQWQLNLLNLAQNLTK